MGGNVYTQLLNMMVQFQIVTAGIPLLILSIAALLIAVYVMRLGADFVVASVLDNARDNRKRLKAVQAEYVKRHRAWRQWQK